MRLTEAPHPTSAPAGRATGRGSRRLRAPPRGCQVGHVPPGTQRERSEHRILPATVTGSTPPGAEPSPVADTPPAGRPGSRYSAGRARQHVPHAGPRPALVGPALRRETSRRPPAAHHLDPCDPATRRRARRHGRPGRTSRGRQPTHAPGDHAPPSVKGQPRADRRPAAQRPPPRGGGHARVRHLLGDGAVVLGALLPRRGGEALCGAAAAPVRATSAASPAEQHPRACGGRPARGPTAPTRAGRRDRPCH
jgi:hypothetical protein